MAADHTSQYYSPPWITVEETTPSSVEHPFSSCPSPADHDNSQQSPIIIKTAINDSYLPIPSLASSTTAAKPRSSYPSLPFEFHSTACSRVLITAHNSSKPSSTPITEKPSLPCSNSSSPSISRASCNRTTGRWFFKLCIFTKHEYSCCSLVHGNTQLFFLSLLNDKKIPLNSNPNTTRVLFFTDL